MPRDHNSAHPTCRIGLHSYRYVTSVVSKYKPSGLPIFGPDRWVCKRCGKEQPNRG